MSKPRHFSVFVFFGAAFCCGVAHGQDALAPFVLPWDDGSPGFASLAGWQEAPAGASGCVTVDTNGHYSVGGKRIRFLGVNLVADDAFPEAGPAAAAASRLAKFGVNCARLHHLDATWAARGLISYKDGKGGNTFEPEALARLHALVTRLKEKGIYSDINLLCARRFEPADGLPAEISQIKWKDQHILAFFDEKMRALQKDGAKRLLATPGPAGEPAFANDPAVAFVEILNENGIIEKWEEGVLDSLPEVYAAELRSRWNEWLRARYPDTAAVGRAWGGMQEALGENLLENGDFARGLDKWSASATPQADASFSVKRGEDRRGLCVNVKRFGESWDSAVVQHGGIRIEPGRLYTLSLDARSTVEGQIYATLHPEGTAEWLELKLVQSPVSAEWRHFQVSFIAPEGAKEARLDFGGFDRVGQVWLSGVSLRSGGNLGTPLAAGALGSGAVPAIRFTTGKGETPTLESRRDWLRFLTSLEHDFWRDMRAYVRDTLGYRGVILGSIATNSPPNVQADMDGVDGHHYWIHVRFATGDWDARKWVVFGRPMTGDPEGSSIGALARQRVQGRPFTVTEYQHAAPNPYAAEGPLLIAAYGAFQDWDGIWFFDYRIPTAGDLAGYAGRFTDFYDDSQHPAKMANYLLAAALFRRGDVAPGREALVVPFPPEREIDVLAARGGQWNLAHSGHLGLAGAEALRRRLALEVGETAASKALLLPKETPRAPHASDTGELHWETLARGTGVVRVDTPRTKALIGAIDGAPRTLGGVTLAVEKTRLGFGTIGLTLLEGESFTAGGRALLVATGEVENTAMGWTDATRSSVGNKWGKAPTLIEVVKGAVTLPVPASRVEVFALDPLGRRQTPVSVNDANGRAQFLFGQSGTTLWYEVAIAPVK